MVPDALTVALWIPEAEEAEISELKFWMHWNDRRRGEGTPFSDFEEECSKSPNHRQQYYKLLNADVLMTTRPDYAKEYES